MVAGSELVGRGPVRHLVLDDGSLSIDVARRIVTWADEMVEDPDVRVVVMSGAVSGCDFDPRDVSPDPAAALARLRVPVVATVDGACWSVGLEMILTADVRLCSSRSTFRVPEVREGRLPSWGGTQRLPRAVGVARATSMLLLGEELDAADAEEYGLVHSVVADLERETAAMVTALLEVAPLAAELAKEAVHRGSELPLRDGLRLEGDLNTLLQVSADRAEGLAAFFAKRAPDFAGR